MGLFSISCKDSHGAQLEPATTFHFLRENTWHDHHDAVFINDVDVLEGEKGDRFRLHILCRGNVHSVDGVVVMILTSLL